MIDLYSDNHSDCSGQNKDHTNRRDSDDCHQKYRHYVHVLKIHHNNDQRIVQYSVSPNFYNFKVFATVVNTDSNNKGNKVGNNTPIKSRKIIRVAKAHKNSVIVGPIFHTFHDYNNMNATNNPVTSGSYTRQVICFIVKINQVVTNDFL